MSLPDAKVRELYKRDRLSCAEIAHIDGCSDTKMYHRLKALGIEMRKRSEANQIFPDSFFVILYNLGLSASQIARMLGVHASTVVKRLHTINFPLRSRAVASAIRYSEEEFQRYFMTSDVLGRLTALASQ